MDIIQIISLIGAFLILIPFAALSLKKMEAKSFSYNILNFIGALLLTITAFVNKQYGFILLESIWSVIGLIGLIKSLKNKKE